MCNLEESGITPNESAGSTGWRKEIDSRNGGTRVRAVEPGFSNVNDGTLLASGFASRYIGRPMLVFEITRMPYRVILENGCEWFETLADCLPRDAEMTTRPNVESFDGKNFSRHA